MAFTTQSVGAQNRVTLLKEESIALGSSTTTYSSAITTVGPDPSREERRATVVCNASAVDGTNIDVALYGADSETGTKFLLLDAVVADLTGTGLVAGTVDLNDYPAAVYFLGFLTDADESSNTVTARIFA